MMINRSEGRRYSGIYLPVNLLQLHVRPKEKKLFIDQYFQSGLAIWNFSRMLSSCRFFSFQLLFLLSCLFTSAFTSRFKEFLFTLTMKMKQQQYLDEVSSYREHYKTKQNKTVTKKEENNIKIYYLQSLKSHGDPA